MSLMMSNTAQDPCGNGNIHAQHSNKQLKSPALPIPASPEHRTGRLAFASSWSVKRSTSRNNMRLVVNQLPVVGFWISLLRNLSE